MHLAIDGFGFDRDRLNDVETVRRFLLTYPDSLGMTRISEPTVFYYHAPKPEDSGVSGFVIIAESHISVHTFPFRDYVNIDLFSCKAFDHERALQEVREYFGLREVRSWALERGLEYLEGRALAARGARGNGAPGEA